VEKGFEMVGELLVTEVRGDCSTVLASKLGVVQRLSPMRTMALTRSVGCARQFRWLTIGRRGVSSVPCVARLDTRAAMTGVVGGMGWIS